MGVREVAERLGVCTATVYRLCGERALTHIRILNTIRIAPEDLLGFIASQRQSGHRGCAAAIQERTSSPAMAADLVSIGKFLSYVLRHAPESIGLTLDEEGWTDLAELIEKARAHGRPLTREIVERVVATNDKKRYALSPDGTRIRASQGHSIDVDLGLPAVEPPPTLFHGTADRFVDSIRRGGLQPGSRKHVHLSKDRATAERVGGRHGRAVVLEVDATAAYAAGIGFYLSENDVWLADPIPPAFLRF